MLTWIGCDNGTLWRNWIRWYSQSGVPSYSQKILVRKLLGVFSDIIPMDQSFCGQFGEEGFPQISCSERNSFLCSADIFLFWTYGRQRKRARPYVNMLSDRALHGKIYRSTEAQSEDPVDLTDCRYCGDAFRESNDNVGTRENIFAFFERVLRVNTVNRCTCVLDCTTRTLQE